MKEEKQMIVYKENWWSKIKLKIIRIFKPNYSEPNNEKMKNTEETEKALSKDEFMEVYKGVKAGTVDMKTLDNKTLERIMILLNEEINLTYNILKDKLNKIDLSLFNTMIYAEETKVMMNSNKKV